MLGKSLPLNISRKFLIDLFWIARRVPMSVIAGNIRIGPLIEARNTCENRPPYTVIFAKALAQVAADMPELRRNYIRYPRPHLFETFESSVSIMIERELDGEMSVIPILLKSPRTQSLGALAREMNAAKTHPQNEVRHISRLLKITRLPLPLRRMLWLAAYQSGRQRSNYFGSFAISALGVEGAMVTYPLSPVTTCLTYGPFGADGSVDVRISFDHRVYDGSTVARTITALERILNSQMVGELKSAKGS